MRNICKYITLVIGYLLMSGCETHFEPILDPGNYVYSIQGVLDASKDTQSVRISPLRQAFRLNPEPLDAEVTLEHLDSGESVVMQDSLRHYGGDAWAWNYYTDMPILPGNSYRLTATRSDGSFSRATVLIPEAVQEPEIRCNCESNRLDNILIHVENAERTVFAEATYYYTAQASAGLPAITDTRSHPVSQLHNHLTTPLPSPERLIWVTVYSDIGRLAANLGRNRFTLNIEDLIDFQFVVAGPEWPETADATIEELSLAIENSNIENGVGRLAGIITMDNYKLRYNYPCPTGFPPPVCGWREEDQ